MEQYIPKSVLVTEIDRIKKEECPIDTYEGRTKLFYFERFLYFINTLKVKEVGSELTWEDVARIHNILNKCKNEKLYDTKKEFYQDTLKRFKIQKGKEV